MGIPVLNHISESDYLKAERLATEKHEYFRGEIFAMSGTTIEHNIIAVNCISELRNRLKGKRCRPYESNLRIHIPKNSLYTYPDISIIFGDVDTLEDKFDTATNPTVIFEILLKSKLLSAEKTTICSGSPLSVKPIFCTLIVLKSASKIL